MVCFLKILCLLLFLIVSPAAMASNAGLLLAPTRVVMENGARYATVDVRNTGDATGRYTVELIDAVMSENGAVKAREDGSKDEFSAIPMVSLSPGRMTLKPNESQAVRLLVKNKQDLPDGEYRAHLRVSMTEANLTPDGMPIVPEKGTGISVLTKTVTIIPIIVRKGQTSFQVTIDDAKLVMGGGDKQQVPMVNVSFNFSGNRSMLGDVKVMHIAPDGKEVQIGFFQGLAIYRNVAKRNQAIVLEIPDGVNLHSGRLRIDLLAKQSDGGQVLSEKEIQL
jgi:hypothetical protein